MLHYLQDLRSMPLTTRWMDGKVCVDQVLSSAFARKGVRRGLQVVAIDGEAPLLAMPLCGRALGACVLLDVLVKKLCRDFG